MLFLRSPSQSDSQSDSLNKFGQIVSLTRVAIETLEGEKQRNLNSSEEQNVGREEPVSLPITRDTTQINARLQKENACRRTGRRTS